MEIKFFKAKKSFKKGGIHIDPNIYWCVSLVLGFIVIIASIIFGFWLFNETGKKFTNEGEEAGQIQTINKDRIEEALLYFNDREKNREKIIYSPSPISDPSR